MASSSASTDALEIRERRVPAELGPDLALGERVLRAALLVREIGAERLARRELYADAAREGLRVRRILGGLVDDLGRDGEHSRIGDRLLREVRDRDVAAHEHRGHRVLERELALVVRARNGFLTRRLEHERHARRRDGDRHRVDLVRGERPPRRAPGRLRRASRA